MNQQREGDIDGTNCSGGIMSELANMGVSSIVATSELAAPAHGASACALRASVDFVALMSVNDVKSSWQKLRSFHSEGCMHAAV